MWALRVMLAVVRPRWHHVSTWPASLACTWQEVSARPDDTDRPEEKESDMQAWAVRELQRIKACVPTPPPPLSPNPPCPSLLFSPIRMCCRPWAFWRARAVCDKNVLLLRRSRQRQSAAGTSRMNSVKRRTSEC